MLGAGQIVVEAVLFAVLSVSPLTLPEAVLLRLLVALALGTVGDVDALVVILAALGTALLGAGIAGLLAAVLLTASLDAGLLSGRLAVKTTVGNIDYIFLKGGKIFQVPPTEVVASGGHWGSGGQDQQSSGHKVKLHSSVGQKSIQVAIFDECDVIGGGAES